MTMELVWITNAQLGIAQATAATAATAILIGVGYISRPSRSALLWSLSFVAGMMGSFGAMVADATGVTIVRTLAMGVMLVAPTLIWCGIRVHRQAPARVWVPILQAAVTAGALTLSADTVWYSLVFRFAFLAAAVFAGLTVWEIRRIPERNERLLLPLVLASAAFLPLGVFTAVAGFVFPLTTGDDLGFVRAFNTLAMIVYTICALTSLMALIFLGDTRSSAGTWRGFLVTMADRITRAARNDERSWTLAEFRLDDLATIRDAGGLTAFASTVARFEDAVRSSFPAEADIGYESPGRCFVLVARPPAVVRISTRAALDRISWVDPREPLTVQLSASAGWATTEVSGYDVDALLLAAATAADRAAADGGDRWIEAGRV